MTAREMLERVMAARGILAQCWIPWHTSDGRGGHCQLGALGRAFGYTVTCRVFAEPEDPHYAEFVGALKVVNEAARDLHPELAGASSLRGDDWENYDDFNFRPAVYVNNHLGREAILEVFDEALARLEVRALCEEETMRGETAELEMEEQLCTK